MNIPKFATKARGNVFYEARSEAAKHNDSFGSREKAAELLHIDHWRIRDIELGKEPTPWEVTVMADAYNAPHLENWFCANKCSIGRSTVTQAERCDIGMLSMKLLADLDDTEKIEKSLKEVLQDGRVSPDEVPVLQEVERAIARLADRAAEFRIWLEEHLGEVQR